MVSFEPPNVSKRLPVVAYVGKVLPSPSPCQPDCQQGLKGGGDECYFRLAIIALAASMRNWYSSFEYPALFSCLPSKTACMELIIDASFLVSMSPYFAPSCPVTPVAVSSVIFCTP